MKNIKQNSWRNHPLMKFALISVVFHLGFSFVHFKRVDFFKVKPQTEEKRIFIKLNNSDPKQIVQTMNSNQKRPTKPTFLSEKNNAYDRQSRSQFVDKFQVANKGVRDALKNEEKKTNKTSKAKQIKNLKFSDLAVKATEDFKLKKKKKIAKKNSRRLGLKNGKRTGRGLGASSDFLEDIPLGDFTKLNTQEYEFYGFYHRIRQKLEQFWGNNIQEEAQKFFKKGRSIASESNLITGLTIKLNSQGEIVDIILKSTSGIRELDDAAIKSFNQAGPFPNPPKGMIKQDGKATIEWGFVVNT